MAKAAVEGAEELGENAARRSGKPGARSTRLREVKCFDVPPGMDRAELKRQLDEQMKYINENMTADDWHTPTGCLKKLAGPAHREYQARNGTIVVSIWNI